MARHLNVSSVHSLPLTAWNFLGRVPLRVKIFGIVLAATCSTGLGALVWLNFWLGTNGQTESSADALLELPVVLAIAAAIGLGVAWLLTNVLAYQVQQVTQVARRVQEGDLSQRAPIWASDDIGKLAQSFNAMMDSLACSNRSLEVANAQLGARNEELTALYELALLATNATNLRAILSKALERIAWTCHADAGAILLRREDGLFVLQASLGLDDAQCAALDLRTAKDPFLKQVMAMRQFELSVAETDPSTLGGLGTDATGVIPLQWHGTAVGLVLLLRPANGVFTLDKRTVSFIQALCSEIAIAVENVALWEEVTRKEAVRARLLANVVTAQEQERERISRELHDETGQSLTALLVQLRVFEHLHVRDDMLAHAASLRTLVLETLDEVRRLARDLRPATLDELGLVPTIEGHVRTFTRNSPLRVTLITDIPEEFRLPSHMELALYRVVQEGLTNIARHACATNASVKLEQHHGTLCLSIEDDGQGFDVAAVMNSEERGLGLHGIQERVELIGGRLTLVSVVGKGTRLSVDVPVLEKANGR